MLKKNPLLKYLMTDKPKSEIFHSSTYARAQNQASFGSTSDQSFTARQQLDQQRSVIQNYKFSKIASGAGRSNFTSSSSASAPDISASAIPSPGNRFDSAQSSAQTNSLPGRSTNSSVDLRRNGPAAPSSRFSAPASPRPTPAKPSFVRPPFSRPK